MKFQHAALAALCSFGGGASSRLRGSPKDDHLKVAPSSGNRTLVWEGSSGCEINEPPLPDQKQIPGRCVKLSDLAVGYDAGFLEPSGSESAKQITDAFDQVAARLVELVAGDFATDNFCFGNFEGTYFENAADASLFNDPIAVDGCHNLPLNVDSEYTVLSSAVTIPKGVCSNAKAKQATFCVAISICPETKLPTVAVNINDQTIGCVADKVPVAGLATAVSNAAGLDFDIGFGISLSNQFHVDLVLYTGLDDWNDKLITYPMKAMYYDRISMSIDPFKSTKKTQDESVLAFSVRGTRAAGIEGLDPETIDSIFSSYEAEYNDAGGVANDVLDSFLTFGEEVSIQAGMVVDLQLALDFSKLKNNVLKKLLPKSETYDLASANLFMQTAATTRTVTTINESGESTRDIVVRPGIYAFAGIGAIQNIIYGLFEYVLNFVSSIITLVYPDFDWEGLTNDIIQSNFDAQEDDSFGFGASVTDKGFGIILNLPVAFGDTGSFKAECKFEYDGTELDCSTETNLFKMFWKTIWKEVEGGVLYIAEETSEFFEDTGKVIAAGFEDAFDSVEDVFSKENVDATAKHIVDELSGVGEDIGDWASDVGEDIGDWAIGVLGEDWEDGKLCGLGTTCRLCVNPATYWYGKALTACGSEPKWNDGALCAKGTTCNACKNPSTYWYGKAFTACGSEPKWRDGTTCAKGTTCNACKNGATYWYGFPAFTKCGTEPGWADGTKCLLGTSCNACKNKATYHYAKAFTACGPEPKTWNDGRACALGTTCNACKNKATWWTGKAFTACGSEPCWGRGTVCGTGTTCHKCCSGNRRAKCPWYQAGICTCG